MELPHLGPLERTILVELANRQSVTLDGVIQVAYGHRPDGGPDDAEGCIRVSLTRLRKKLRPLGIQVVNIGRGYHAPSYYAIRGVERAVIRKALTALYGPEILRKAA
jgi:hypothetical protein